MSTKKSFLIILDGWGIGEDPAVDAIQLAHTPYFDGIMSNRPHAQLVTFGEQVGLPEGQMGNSEVGHLNIGAGRIVFQELARINNACRDGSLGSNEVIQKMIQYSVHQQKPVHLFCLLSDGGVHAHVDHLKHVIDVLETTAVEKIYIHAFLDGRDTDPLGGKQYMEDLQNFIKNKKAKVATIIGRYYAMDRDNRFERIKLAYDLLIKNKGAKFEDPVSAIQHFYDSDITDEFMEPISIQEDGVDVCQISPEDVVFFLNFRTDRPRQLTRVLTQEDMPEYGMQSLPLYFVTMVEYDRLFQNIHVVFSKDTIDTTIGEVVAQAGLSQLRIAETEKYPHVTFFFSGGREAPFDGEQRILIPSAKVATYDLKPEMGAIEISDAVMANIDSEEPDFICLNYANTDMVGHTGVMSAAIEAAEVVDRCLEKVTQKALEHDYSILIIADHGNSDKMKNSDGTPHTAHTTNLVPIVLLSNTSKARLQRGILADVAPTLLALMGIKQPQAMTGKSLLI